MEIRYIFLCLTVFTFGYLMGSHHLFGSIFKSHSDGEKVTAKGNGCRCAKSTCGCCVRVRNRDIHLDATVCANVTYISEDIGITMTVTINDIAIFNETVSVHNPPPICFGAPYLKEYAEGCVHLFDVDVSRRTFHACVRLEFRMKQVVLAKYDLGCFTLGAQTQYEYDYVPTPLHKPEYANDSDEVISVVRV